LNVNRRGLLFIGLGLIAAIAAGVVVYSLSTSLGQEAVQASTQPTPIVQTREVVVAAVDIEPSTAITNTHILTANWPVNLLRGDVFTDTEQVLGQTATSKAFGGQPLLKSQFLPAGGRTGVSAAIPPGKVLVAFPSTDILNSTGAVQTGDHVDILLTIPISGTARLNLASEAESQLGAGQRQIVSQITLQNIEVYNTGFWTPPGQATENAQALKVITFVVDPQEALFLKFIKDSGGTIDLIVRSLADAGEVSTYPVNLDALVDVYRFIGLPTTPTPTP
jgi:pilus assembly protein CpaB